MAKFDAQSFVDTETKTILPTFEPKKAWEVDVGDTIQIDGQAHRVDKIQCTFNSVMLISGEDVLEYKPTDVVMVSR